MEGGGGRVEGGGRGVEKCDGGGGDHIPHISYLKRKVYLATYTTHNYSFILPSYLPYLLP
jgi:hypothetical protein